MKPASRIQAGIEILERIASARVPMDNAVGDYMRGRRYIGAKDRGEIAARSYDMMRANARLGWWLSHSKVEDTPRNRMIFWLMLGEGNEAKRLDDLFDGSQYAPDRIEDNERKFISKLAGQTLAHKDMPQAVAVECPPQHEEVLRGYFGDDFADEMRAMLNAATLDLRTNTFLLERENAQKSLAKDGVETEETPFSPNGLRCKSKSYLSRTKAFTKGWVEIQDEGSQLIAHLCGAKPGSQIVDYCAGGGGKTLALAADMKRKGRIVAMDNDAQRLERGRRRYKKAQLADIIEVRCMSDEKTRKWVKRQKGKFDIVLTDVPCSGTGTWRRNPDMRWRTIGPSLDELIAVQQEILEKACGLVKPGGRFVYATCSLLPQENENQVAAFLKAHPEFTLEPLDESLGLGTPHMRLTPHRHSTDGFFAAVMTRADDTEASAE